MLKIAVATALFLAGTACTQLPRAELQAYRDSFQAAQTAAQPMIADYAVAERAQRLDQLPNEAQRPSDGDFLPTFRVTDVGARATIGMPPGADAIDRSFRAVAAYNEALAALAENRNIEEARGQVQQVIGNLAAVAPPLTALEPGIGPVANLLIDALRPAIVEGNRAEFKRRVLEGYPHILALIGILRDHAPTQFSTTTRLLREKARRDPAVADRADVVARINAWHVVFANYVALLNATALKLGDLEQAVRNPRSQSLLAQAVAGSAELRGYAEALRLSLAQLRATP